MNLENKVAVITGGGRGIGEAIALTLAGAGASIVIADLELHSAEEAAGRIASSGGNATALKVDISSGQDVCRMVDAALDRFKRIDILVNNAGIERFAPAAETSESDWRKVMDVNLTGHFLCSQAVGRQMISQNGGKIVFIASAAAHRASPGFVAYAAAKAGIVQLARVLAVEWAKHNINVNSVSPGVTRTAMIDELVKESPSFLEDRVKGIPLRRFNRPEDIANAVLFLSSSLSENITGEDIIVDGGMCALSPASAVAMALAEEATGPAGRS